MSHETEILTGERLRDVVNAELTSRGHNPSAEITRMKDTIFAHTSGVYIEVGRVEYVSGLGEIFEYTYNLNDQ